MSMVACNVTVNSQKEHYRARPLLLCVARLAKPIGPKRGAYPRKRRSAHVRIFKGVSVTVLFLRRMTRHNVCTKSLAHITPPRLSRDIAEGTGKPTATPYLIVKQPWVPHRDLIPPLD